MDKKEIIIVSFKHNGKVHRTWYQTYLIENNEEYMVVGSTHSLVIESDGRKWRANEPAITIFFKKEWFNVVCMIRDEGLFYYVNLASPAFYLDGVIKYIDYDLDFKVSPDFKIKVLDEFEYKKHKKLYNYSDVLDKIIRNKFKMVKQKIVKHEFPFISEKIGDYYHIYEKIMNQEDKEDV